MSKWIILRADSRRDPRASAERWAMRAPVKRPPLSRPKQAAGMLPGEWVAFDLIQRGVAQAWAPVAHRPVIGRRLSRRRPTKQTERYELAPGYIFATSDALGCGAPSILGALLIGERPAFLTDADIAPLREACAQSSAKPAPEALNALIGAAMRVVDGPLAGLMAVVEDVQDGRLVFHSHLLGGARVEMRPDQVAKAAE